MYYLLAIKMRVLADASASPHVFNDTRVVEMGDCNTVRTEITIFSWSSSATPDSWLDVATSVSDDLENWKQVATQQITSQFIGYTLLNAVTGICARYVRLECNVGDPDIPFSPLQATVGIGINLSTQ